MSKKRIFRIFWKKKTFKIYDQPHNSLPEDSDNLKKVFEDLTVKAQIHVKHINRETISRKQDTPT